MSKYIQLLLALTLTVNGSQMAFAGVNRSNYSEPSNAIHYSTSELASDQIRKQSFQFSKADQAALLSKIAKNPMFSIESLSEPWKLIIENIEPSLLQSKLQISFINYYRQTLLAMRLAQNGYLTLARSRESSIEDNLILLVSQIENSNEISAEKRPEILKALITGSFQMGLYQLGELSQSEKIRLNYFVSDLLSDWSSTTPKNLHKRLSNSKFGNWFASTILIGSIAIIIGFGTLASTDIFRVPSHEISNLISNIALYGGSLFAGLNSLFWWTKKSTAQETAIAKSVADFNLSFKPNSEIQNSFPRPMSYQYDSIKSKSLQLDLANDPKNLSAALSETTSTWFGIEKLFYLLRQQEEDPEITKQRLVPNKELDRLAKTGAEFRNFYFNQLQNDFGNESAILDPELDLYKRALLEMKRSSQMQLAELTTYEAEKKAWSDTKLRFSLDEHIEYAEVAQLRMQNPLYHAAFEFRSKRIIQYLNQDTIKPTQTVDDPETFKSIEKTRLNQLRVENFLGAMKLKQNIADADIKVHLNGKRFKVKVSDLAKAEVEFLQTKPAKENLKIISLESNGIFRMIRNGIFEFFAIRKEIDRTDLAEIYKTEVHTPLVPRQWVQIKLTDNEFLLSEKDFNEIPLRLLSTYENRARANGHENRYILEAQRRDTLLSDLITKMYEDKDLELKAFAKRLFLSIEKRNFDAETNKSLTEQIRDNGDSRDGSILDDIRWGGYEFHPMYWSVRDQAAKLSGGRSAVQGEDLILIGSKKEQVQFRAFQHNEKSLAAHRQRSLAGRTLRALALIGALAAIIPTAEMATGLAFNQSGTSSSGGGAGDNSTPSISMRDEFDTKNYGQDGDKEERKQVFLRFTSIKRGVSLPAYVNDVNKAQIPVKYYLDEIDATWDHSEVLEKMPKQALISPSDIEADSVAPTTQNNGKVPLLVPTGYKVVGIDVREFNTNLPIPADQVNVFKIKRFGVSYASLSSAYKGPVRYHIRYVKDKATIAMDSRLLNLDKTILKKIENELQASGADELATEIDKLITKMGPVSIRELENTFANTGTYTFQKEKYFTFDYSSPYKAYSKFLRDGVYFYQCSGSNNLFKDILNEYLTAANLPFEALPMTGFRYEDSKDHEVHGPGHRHVVISHKTIANSFFELDGTPGREDPRDQKEKELEEKKAKEDPNDKSEKGEKYIYMITSRKFQIPETTWQELGKRVNEKNLPGLSSLALETLRQRLSVKLLEISKKNPSFAQIKNKSKLTGLQILAALPYLQKMADGQMHPNYLLKILILLNSGQDLNNLTKENNSAADNEFAQLMKSYKQDTHQAILSQLQVLQSAYEEVLKRQTQGLQSQKRNDSVYLLDSDLQLIMAELYSTLTNSYYGEPKSMLCRHALR